MATILQGQCRVYYAFDVGYEVQLDQLQQLVVATPVPPLSRKKQTPTYLQYTKPPRVLPLGAAPATPLGNGTVQATIFEFGGLSLCYQWNIPAEAGWTIEDLPRLSHQLYQTNLEAHAQSTATHLVETLAPAITRPRLDPLVEDYYLFILERLSEDLSGEELLRRYRPHLAQTLRFELLPLSRYQQEEALSQSISYYENDLALIDWNGTILYDRDYEDSANVLEFLNVELLEARFVDAQLDRRLMEYGPLPSRPRFAPVPFRIPYARQIEDLAELKAEYLLLNERIDNSLKLIGDLYLARLHTAAARRFYLQEWNLIIARKLEIIDDLYQMLTDRVQAHQSQMLELIIILLILVELMVALAGKF
jgi:hypothetical protein